VEPIHHLAIGEEWREAVSRGGPYERSTVGRDLADEGFIHCSTASQVEATASRYYAEHEDVVVLEIAPELLDAEIRVEDLAGTGEAFPHVYGPLPLAAVRAVVPLRTWLATRPATFSADARRRGEPSRSRPAPPARP
jgi:uncharacterized protein (DUF952 family)